MILHQALSLLAVGAAIVVLMMFVLWVTHLPIPFAAIVEVGWAAGLGPFALY